MPAEPYLLAFDTSAAHCAAALLRGDRLIDLRVEEMAKGQVERLMPFLEEMLAGAGLGWRDLAGIGVGTGPGNFTGIRISVAAARGLALSLSVPAIGVSTLEAMAHGHLRPVTTEMDARRGMIYRQVFGADGPEAPAYIARDDAGDPTGTGIGEITAEAMIRAIAEIAMARLQSGETVPRPAPLYLRAADAAPSSDPPPRMLD